MHLTRFWMTGCMALVLLAAGRWPLPTERDEPELERRGWVTVDSALSLDETVRRLQRAASLMGLPVLAQVSPQRTPGHQALGVRSDRFGAGYAQIERRLALPPQVLVLGRPDGHTPIWQAGSSSVPDLPLRVLVQALPDGSSRVMYSSAQAWAQRDQALPPDCLHDLAALPDVVHTALAPGQEVTVAA